MAFLSISTISFAVLGIFGYWLVLGLYNVYLHPMSRVPGPKLWLFSQLPAYYHIFRGDLHTVINNLHDKYGPVVRYGPDRVSFITADAFKAIYGHKNDAVKTFEKHADRYKSLPGHVDHIVNADHENHKRMRRLISHAFSDKALRNQEPVLQAYVAKLMDGLARASKEGESLDLVQWYNFATFDLIGDLTFGQSFHCLENVSLHPWIRLIFQGVKASTYIDLARRFKVDGLANYIMPASLKKSADEHHALTHETVMRRLSGGTNREDFMSYILRHNDEKGLTKDEIVENSNILIIAGSETTATLLSGATYHMLKNPGVMRKVVDEVRAAFASEDEITIQEVNQLPYTVAVLTEGLRMYPPVPGMLPRQAPKGGEYVEGYFIPEGTIVGVQHWAAFQSAQNFRNPSQFVPERWLGDAEYAGDQKAVLQPFSMGPRNCVGKNLAYAEMRLIFARILWTYDIELMPESENWSDQPVFTLWEKKELRVKLTRRAGLPEAAV